MLLLRDNFNGMPCTWHNSLTLKSFAFLNFTDSRWQLPNRQGNKEKVKKLKGNNNDRCTERVCEEKVKKKLEGNNYDR